MPTATTFIPTFCAIILALGGTNGFSIQLMLIGTLATIIHAAWSPPDLTTPYPNFDDYHPTQPPFRDYVLVFGLVGLILVALFSRIRPSLRSFVRATWRKMAPRTAAAPGSSSRVQGVSIGFNPQPTHHAQPRLPPPPTPPSRTFTDQSTTTTSTLADGTPSSEIASLKARVSQLEASLDEMKCRLDALTAGQQDVPSGITMTVVAESSPLHTPLTPPGLNSGVPPQPPSLPPSPYTFAQNLSSKSVDSRERLRSIARSLMDGTRVTDRWFLKIRTILAEIKATDYEDASPPRSRSMQSSLTKNAFPSPPVTPITPYPYPSPSPSPSVCPEAVRTTRRIRVPLSLSPAVGQVGKMPKTSGNPRFNMALDLLGISKVPCSTPVQSAKETERSISSTPSSFSGLFEAGVGPPDRFEKPVLKRSEEKDMRVRPVTRVTSILSRVAPQNATPRDPRNPLSRLRERSSTTRSLPLSRPLSESTPNPKIDAKGKRRAVRALAGMSDWLVENRRRKRESLQEACPLHRDCRG